MTVSIFILCIVLAAAGVTDMAVARPKTDKVMVKNGDEITCEIKSLSRGMLTVKTDDMGTIEIKWTEVIALRSQFYFQVETESGNQVYGSLELTKGSDMLVVSGATTVSVEEIDVVEIVPLEQNFWDRNDGSLSFGFSFTKGSDVRQLTFDWSNLYRTERNIVSIKASAIVTSKGEGEPLNRQSDFSATYFRLLAKKKWTGSLNAGLQRNDELGLERRVILGFGLGLNLIKSNRSTLLVSVGAALNSELGTDTTDVVQSAEAVLAANYSFFRYNTPKTDLTSSLNVFPSITEDDRVRLDFNVKYAHELIADFTLNLTFFTNYDSQPPSAGAATTDYGIVLSVGWSY